ncbi:MAG TPA: LysR family transcriptional regulator [Methylovorus sp.]|jgi:DNA-binding transcriptional LysR family regulator|nr:LysR family transcriptional regulator [Methylovorus sp.]
MKLEANDLLMFARVVDEGSFSRAAERLHIPKSTLSRRMAALEAQLGERLLLRTTRKLTVTDFGNAVLAHAHQVTAEVEATLALTQHRQVEPSGRLRLSMPGDFGLDILQPLLAEFAMRYPAISLEMDISPRRVDLIGENFDVAIRMGDLPDDTSLAARRIATFGTGLYAAPAYLQKRGTPHEPEALMEHDALHLLTRRGEPALWRLSHDQAQWSGTPIGKVSANSPAILVRMATAGLGIAMLGEPFAEPYVKQGSLVKILEDWQLPSVTAWAVFPGRRLMPARTRVFLDALIARFAAADCEKHQR